MTSGVWHQHGLIDFDTHASEDHTANLSFSTRLNLNKSVHLAAVSPLAAFFYSCIEVQLLPTSVRKKQMTEITQAFLFCVGKCTLLKENPHLAQANKIKRAERAK